MCANLQTSRRVINPQNLNVCVKPGNRVDVDYWPVLQSLRLRTEFLPNVIHNRVKPHWNEHHFGHFTPYAIKTDVRNIFNHITQSYLTDNIRDDNIYHKMNVCLEVTIRAIGPLSPLKCRQKHFFN